MNEVTAHSIPMGLNFFPLTLSLSLSGLGVSPRTPWGRGDLASTLLPHAPSPLRGEGWGGGDLEKGRMA